MEGVHDQSKGINPQGYPVTGFPDDGDVVMPLAASVKSTAPASSSEPNKPVVPTILGSFVQNEVEYVAMSNVQFRECQTHSVRKGAAPSVLTVP